MSVRSARLRRPLAALFAAAAAGLALTALRPGPPPSVRVLGAARDLPAGKALTASDLRPVALPPGAVPAGALRSGGAGRVLAGPMREGEPSPTPASSATGCCAARVPARSPPRSAWPTPAPSGSCGPATASTS
ncbi:SAF domain-containing protein [Actinomadura madurae]|uniref:SAF domain-containing protein n=1 Tax=Actinomadura madurae TaxID=1993 RepID=UPI0020270273|nr:SAF domain-containing protein [Actinomadura madurae]URN09621.1 SAF domain-containing protein [Actinomadura madurae]